AGHDETLSLPLNGEPAPGSHAGRAAVSSDHEPRLEQVLATIPPHPHGRRSTRDCVDHRGATPNLRSPFLRLGEENLLHRRVEKGQVAGMVRRRLDEIAAPGGGADRRELPPAELLAL